MPRSSNLKDYGIDEEIDPKTKFNSLISVTVSTVMCLAAKCPLPKPNVETTKLFLSTITDDKGKAPRNIKGLLNLLNHYSGPYEAGTINEKCFEESPVKKLMIEEGKISSEVVGFSKASRTLELVKEMSPSLDGQTYVKRSSKTSAKKNEKETLKRGSRHLGSRISPSKSVLSNKT